MKSRRVLITGIFAFSSLVVFSGLACPPNGDDMLPAPIPGPPGTDATVTAGDGVLVANGVVSLDTDFTDGLYWKLGGNAGTTAGANFLGTTDGQALELHVDGVRALRLEPTANCPNIIGGFNGNVVTNGVVAATIAGGGPSNPADPTTGNRVFDDFGTIGGGGNNRAGRDDGDTTNDSFATVGGGGGNEASGTGATIGGGGGNLANGLLATIGGGESNEAGGVQSTVGGGESNDADGEKSTVGGGGQNRAIGGGATIGGGLGNDSCGDLSTVGGGSSNNANGVSATIGGGSANDAFGLGATIGGGLGNDALAAFATIAGGGRSDPDLPATGNVVSDEHGTIGGGGNNKVGIDDGSSANQIFGTVGGGRSNRVVERFCTIGGGQDNQAGFLVGGRATAESRGATSTHATIGGGQDNLADNDHASIGGGLSNHAGGLKSTVGGGQDNLADNAHATVGGGFMNHAGGVRAAVGGGESNNAAGSHATVPGGINNSAAGEFSFAAGRRAKAANDGSFVWGDNTDFDVTSPGNNTFTVRAAGGTAFFSSGDQSTGVFLPAGGGAWLDLSDRNVKENFEKVDGRKILERLAAIPIETWNYKAQDDAIRHIGPMAQDFHAAFGVGHDDKHISTIDTDGVALAAIQGLHQLVQEKDAALSIQQRRIEKLEARLKAIEALIMDTNAILK